MPDEQDSQLPGQAADPQSDLLIGTGRSQISRRMVVGKDDPFGPEGENSRKELDGFRIDVSADSSFHKAELPDLATSKAGDKPEPFLRFVSELRCDPSQGCFREKGKGLRTGGRDEAFELPFAMKRVPSSEFKGGEQSRLSRFSQPADPAQMSGA